MTHPLRVAVIPLLALLLGTVLTACEPAPEPYHGFALRNSFGGGAQLSPSYESKAAVTCMTIYAAHHVCRHVYGYEEGGASYTYYLDANGVKTFTDDDSFGWALVTAQGGRYEGCAYVGYSSGHYEKTWVCDYRTNWHTLYSGSGSYLKVFKEWASVVSSQALCASAWGAWWGGSALGKAGWLGLVKDCGVQPYNPKAKDKIDTEPQPIDAGTWSPVPVEPGVVDVVEGAPDDEVGTAVGEVPPSAGNVVVTPYAWVGDQDAPSRDAGTSDADVRDAAVQVVEGQSDG